MADLATSLDAPPSGRAAPVWFDSLAYCREKLLGGTPVPWASPGELSAFFAKAQVNRVWFHLFGRGLVEPNDDFRAANPPANPTQSPQARGAGGRQDAPRQHQAPPPRAQRY